MISGTHVMNFTRDEDADRAFLHDIVGIPKMEYRDALRQFLDKYGKDMPADQVTAYRDELNRLD